MANNKMFDIAIVGGGIVGCSALFELTRQGFSCVLLEKNQNIMGEASAGNSGMLHTGFDAPLDSLEMECIKECQKHIFPVIDKFHIPFSKCGTVLVAWTEQERVQIPTLLHKTQQANLGDDITQLTASELHRMEPGLRHGCQGALHVPRESVVDSWLLGVALAHHARQQGAQIMTNCTVHSAAPGELHTDMGVVRAKVTLNCAGLYGDKVDGMQGLQSFSIKPRKGQYCVFDRKSSHLFKNIIFPVPTEQSKGIALFKTVYDNVIAGPTAVDVSDRSPPPFDPATHNMLTQHAHKMLPELGHHTPQGYYLGVRPATQFKDYQIKSYPDKQWMSVGGVRSTGVSASLGIGRYLADKVTSDMGLEPSLGISSDLEDLQWSVTDGGRGVVFVGEHEAYDATHPIFTYGHQGIDSRL